jgi:hypothetical protein
MSRHQVVVTVLGLAMAASPAPIAAQPPSGAELEQGFASPPDAARPRAWWHWMNGNVTKEGITADLEWMKRVGIGGFQMFDGNLGTPQLIEDRLVWMAPEWKDAFRHAAAEADRLGLEMAMAASGGWSETGGPWVKPEQAMKKLVWSETRVDGPRRFGGKLPQPPSVNGAFQDMPLPPGFSLPPANVPGAIPTPELPPEPADPTFYADSAVIAYRLPQGEMGVAERRPAVTSSAGSIDGDRLLDGDLNGRVTLALPGEGEAAWVQLEFAEPLRAHAFTVATGVPASPFGGESIPQGELQASDDGTRFTTLVTLPGGSHPFAAFPVRTYSFAATTARYFRLVVRGATRGPIAELLGLPPPGEVPLAELTLHSGPRVNRWESKAAFGNAVELEGVPTPPVAGLAVSRDDVLDLTSRMGPDGTLDCEVPEGSWAILRLGYSLTGHENSPASREATGFEVDKLSREHVEAYMEGYLGPISEALGPLLGKSFRYLLMDSWEAGLQNWSEEILAEFRARRGYDPTPYLPVLVGRVVESADASDRFLWDFRRTIADLIAENHYGVAAAYLAERGLGLYAEAMGAGAPVTADALQDKGRVDIPMGEFWVRPGHAHTPEHPTDVKEAASGAHIYDKPFVAVEAFTTGPPMTGWQAPSYLKPYADYFFALGMNRIVFHTSDHQPFVDGKHKPGITLGPFGQHYTRNNTWAEQAVAWNDYLARCSFLLQQGHFVGDLLYYYGEGVPLAVPYWKRLDPAPPEGYDYDWVNTEVLLDRLSVEGGRLVLPHGPSYRALVLPADLDRLTLPVVRRIRDLVAAGAVVVAPRPGPSPSLTGQPEGDEEIRAIASSVWGAIDGRLVKEHTFGEGSVHWGASVGGVLAAKGVAPDLRYSRPRIDTELVWIHRRVGDADLYFVANQRGREERVEASFRVEGREAELWDPVSGEIAPAGYRIEDGRTMVSLELDPHGSVFVFFRRPASEPVRERPRPASAPLATVEGPWTLRFPSGWGAPAEVEVDTLGSWTESPQPGVRHFSGTGAYTRTLDVPADWLRPERRVLLDLGDVREIAEVEVNGQELGILWTPPFRADVTDALRAGENQLEVRITNLWSNRMIGDQELPPEERFTWTTFNPYDRGLPFGGGREPVLLESGLLGPVTLTASDPIEEGNE